MSLADDYNLRAGQASFTDVADFADSFEDIKTWTPTYGFIGGGTSATINTFHEAKYIKLGGGRLVYVQAAMRLDLVGTGTIVTISLPFAVSATPFGVMYCVADPNTGIYETMVGITELSRIDIIRRNAVNYTTGTWNFQFSGLYITT